MTQAALKQEPKPPIRFRGRNFMAITLAPEPPIADWLAEFDALVQRSAGFFGERPVVLDLKNSAITRAGFDVLMREFRARDVHVIWVEGADASWHDRSTPPMIGGARPGRPVDPAKVVEADADGSGDAPVKSLVVDATVRSGQSVVFLEGDVTILGSVAWGAQIIAGGSIHVYGALRGRASAGSTGLSSARIFCRKLDPELLAIDGHYRTADDLDDTLRGGPAQALLQGEDIVVAGID